MVKDFKNRARPQSQPQRKSSHKGVSVWRVLWVILLLLGFGYFLNSLRHQGIVVSEQAATEVLESVPQQHQVTVSTPKESAPVKKERPHEPRYDFFTLLPEKEVVIPDYEIKTRKREERSGKVRNAHYMMQVGSFRNNKDADRLKAKLALIGIESKIELAKIGDVNWYRVKLGPFLNMSAVETVRQRLRKNFIDAVVTEK